MKVEIQYQIRKNPVYLRYLRENSNWYKTLNRYPEEFKQFEEEVKTNYKLRPVDKFEKVIDTFDMIQAILKTLN